MKQIKNILVPYDGSNCSKHAFKLALDMAQKFHSKLILVSCIEKINDSWFGHEHLPFYQKEVKKFKEKIKKEITLIF
ncbi:MAG: universal stress protein [Nitrosopumilus sp.]|nr:universal stress protein [Nitrosopumilus sp.]MDH3736577.1 universal stress protein [Nitrosopumilus sp.]MDH3832663.1 universal stress protein [Nitrosopumilus sp.]